MSYSSRMVGKFNDSQVSTGVLGQLVGKESPIQKMQEILFFLFFFCCCEYVMHISL